MNGENLGKRLVAILLSGATLSGAVGCATPANQFADQLNPYADAASAELGEHSTSAISGNGGGKSAELARHAVEVLGTYRRAQAPQPTYPVIQPAEVRLMWIPDHLNRHGDLVPAHYYYLRVLNDRWAVQDAFEVERQLGEGDGKIDYGSTGGGGGGGGGGGSGATPWVYKETK